MQDNTDPRMAEEHVRRLGDTPNELTLVGVVHDHPASTYRASRTVRDLDPDCLALELPPIAIPLFERYADGEREPPVFGGEMSAAVQAARTDDVVGVDRPTSGYFATLARNLLRERPSRTTLRKLLVNTASTTKHAIACRVAAVVADRVSVRLEVDCPVPHDTDWSDTPADQAADERKEIRQSRAFMNAFQSTSSSRASRFEDATREEHMAARLSRLRRDGSVVAVVGIDHLDPLVRRLKGGDPATESGMADGDHPD